MPRQKDSFRDYVEFLQNNKWKCSFCNNEYGGSVTRIKAHLAGVVGYGINDCKAVNGGVRLEARNALNLKGRGAAESGNGAEGNIEAGSHQPMSANDDDARRETSFVAMPHARSDVTSTVGASSSAFLSLPNPSVPAQIVVPDVDFSSWPPPPQYHAGDFNIQLQNLSYPITHPDLALEALANMPAPVNAEEGGPNTDDLQGARTEDADGVSKPGSCGLVDRNVPSLKRKREERSNREVVNDCRHCSFRKSSTTPLLTAKLVGKESEETIKKICNYLMEDEIVRIGIYGMGGVGKTAILMHVHNRLLENPTFNDVFWVTIPQKSSVYELQDEIANVVGLDNLSKVKDMKRRACILDEHLKKKKRSILLLDGMWVHFEVEDVGIPIEQGGLKLVLTTRSLDVCCKMLCQKRIKAKPLHSLNDPWRLFLDKLCYKKEIPSEVEEIARSIVDKCRGLPLGIIEIATRMRGVEEVHEWKDMLRKLNDSRLELDVFKTLKLSYINLDESRVQRCFLHSMLCFGEYNYTREDLMEFFIDEGLIDRMATRREQHNEGNTILDKIRKACLLDDPEDEGGFLDVHPLIRDMALQIVASTTNMVKACMALEEIPEEEFWTDHLEGVFLQSNHIKEIPHGISPNCPKLTRLSLNDNVCLKAIHNSFFSHLKGLKVLDLSNTGLTELPDVISCLESLEALLLQDCEELYHIPCVRKLGSLRKLDLWGCKSLEDVPEGMEMLEKLRYLNLLHTKIKTLPEEVLGKLVNLQYLVIRKVKLRDEMKLKKVEALYCSVPDVGTFNSCARLIEQNSSPKYKLALNVSIDYLWRPLDQRRIIIEGCHSIINTVRIAGKNGGVGSTLIPENVQVLDVGQCCEVTSLLEVSPLNDLETLRIREWRKLEELGSVHFPRLRNMTITGCSKLKNLFAEWQNLPHLEWFEIRGLEELEWINIATPSLGRITVCSCPKMKTVVELECLVTRLPNLKTVQVFNCEKLEEIIGGTLSSVATCGLEYLAVSGCKNLKRVLITDMLLHLPFLQNISVENCEGIEAIIDTIPNMTHSFPNLIDLSLSNLPELKSICDGLMSCDKIKNIYIRCPKLKRIPLQLPRLDDGLPSPPPSLQKICIRRQMWESLEWDDPRARSSLQHLVKFYRKSPPHIVLFFYPHHLPRALLRIHLRRRGVSLIP